MSLKHSLELTQLTVLTSQGAKSIMSKKVRGRVRGRESVCHEFLVARLVRCLMGEFGRDVQIRAVVAFESKDMDCSELRRCFNIAIDRSVC